MAGKGTEDDALLTIACHLMSLAPHRVDHVLLVDSQTLSIKQMSQAVCYMSMLSFLILRHTRLPSSPPLWLYDVVCVVSFAERHFGTYTYIKTASMEGTGQTTQSQIRSSVHHN